MKLIRASVILIFCLSLGVFGFTEYRERVLKDSTIPVITSEQDTLELSVHYEDKELFNGLKAYDEKDGDLTEDILVGEFSTFVEKGICRVKYVVFDSSNQPAELTRKVHFTDYQSPKFTLTQPLVFPTKSYEDILKYIGANDDLDGNITAYVKKGTSSVDFYTVGDYTYQVEVTNSFGDTQTQELPVHIIERENQNLQINLTNNIIYVKKGESVNPMDYVDSVKNYQGLQLDLSCVTASASPNTRKEGVTEVHYTATDEYGQKGETWMTVVVRE